ncbi:MAG: copper chaperone PCu(A)C [Rugosibacter sp.]|nr:MAG: copper chaperone PCu(A)C [Rugosibacter sp.]TBR11358.1 MAG: copper chaperone PCu(A)C [Rugosibacter sp.]
MSRLIQTSMLFTLLTLSAYAEVTVQNPWIRPSVPQQKVTGAFMSITSTTDARLVGITSPVAERVEIHEMTMENDVMKMRALSSLPLVAGKAVKLAPGGSYHIMLFDLHQQIKAGDTIPLTLTIEDDQKRQSSIKVKANAKRSAAQ